MSFILDILSSIAQYVINLFGTLSRRFFSATNMRRIEFNNGLNVSIGETIGEGAFSFVYKAKSDNETYALKKMYIQSPELAKCAKVEIDSFRMFQHNSVLKLVDSKYCTEKDGENVVYMLFPFMQHGSLRSVLNMWHQQSQRRPKLSHILVDFLSICDALLVLHNFSPSYVHQDIKPENILINNNGRPLLTDFGSVRPADVFVKDRSQALAVADSAAQYCTISYRSPELFDPPTGITIDCRTDVWAIGCLLFAWWHGYSPYECELLEYGVKVVECTHLRVLSKIPVRAVQSREDAVITNVAESILMQDITNRPFLPDIMNVIKKKIAEIVKDE